MKQNRFIYSLIITIVTIVIFAQSAQAQTKNISDDTSTAKLSLAIDSLGKKVDTSTVEIKTLKSAIKADTLIPYVANKLERFGWKIHHSNRIMRDMTDFSELDMMITAMNKGLNRAQKRMTDSLHRMNLQSMNTTAIILDQAENTAQEKLSALNVLYNNLTNNNLDIKGILKDPIFHLNGIPDTTLINQLADLKLESTTIDSTETINIAKINLMRSKLSTLILRIKDVNNDLMYKSGNLYAAIWNKDEPALFHINNKTYSKNTLPVALKMAVSTTMQVISIYMMGKVWIIFLAIFILAATLWIAFKSKYQIRKSNIDSTAVWNPVRYLHHSIILSAFFAASCYFPFFFKNPPMSFLNTMDIVRYILLFLLLRPLLHKRALILWSILTVLSILVCLDNQLLESTKSERFILAFIQLILIVWTALCSTIFLDLDYLFDKKRLPKIMLFASFFILCFSLFANISGRVTISRIATYTASQMLMLSMTYKVFSKIALEFMYLYSESNIKSRISAFINYSQLRNRYMNVLQIFCTIAIFIDIAHGLYLYSPILFIGNFILMSRHQIGEFTFTLYSITTFILIIYISAIISRFVRFILATTPEETLTKKNKIGSMTLLIRLAIWIIGFLIAIAAAGIPLDKVTVMLSALGVGIGFGLQNIANNLVSGVILAFERPIQIGDSIEIGSTSGTVTEIGVRSSKLAVTEGGDVIIPNGDLLSQRITNWTLTNRSKRDFFPLRICYGEDLYVVKQIIEDVLKESTLIYQNPPFAVSVSNFEEYSVLMKVFFWVKEVDNSSSVRSQLMYQIYTALKDNDIQMPSDEIKLKK